MSVVAQLEEFFAFTVHGKEQTGTEAVFHCHLIFDRSDRAIPSPAVVKVPRCPLLPTGPSGIFRRIAVDESRRYPGYAFFAICAKAGRRHNPPRLYRPIGA